MKCYMKYAVNEAGVSALQNISTALMNSVADLFEKTSQLQTITSDNEDSLGPHKASFESGNYGNLYWPERIRRIDKHSCGKRKKILQRPIRKSLITIIFLVQQNLLLELRREQVA